MTDRQIIEKALKVIENEIKNLKETILSIDCCIEDDKKEISDLIASGEEYLIANTLVQESRKLEYALKSKGRLSIKLQEKEVLKSILKGEEPK